MRKVAAAIIGGLIALAAIVFSARLNLNGDVTYALGGISTASEGGVSIWQIFIARPLTYKLLIGVIDDLQRIIVGNHSFALSHVLVRAETVLLIAAVTVVLFVGVRRFAGGRAAAGVSIAAGLALAVAPPWHFLEPDWVAALAGALAVGAALAPRRLWLGATLGGIAAMTVVAVKLATFPIALLALLMIFLFHRRRALWTAVATVVAVAAWYLVTKLTLPWELIWLSDQAQLVQSSPIHNGIRLDDIRHLLFSVGDMAVLSPFVWTAPAAAAVLIHRRPAGRERWIATGIAVVALGLSVAPAYGQGEFFQYHFAVVPVLAASVWGVAFAVCTSARIPLTVLTLLATGLSVALLRQPAAWRDAHPKDVTIAIVVFAILAAVVTWFFGRFTSVSVPWLAGLAVLCVALVQASVPGTPYAFSTFNYNIYAKIQTANPYQALSDRIGPDTPVLYLTFGTINEFIGNPTGCRYPSPQWLQRATYVDEVREFRSYDDNLRCLSQPSDAKYLVVQPSWFNIGKSTEQVRTLINQKFDCSPAARIPAPATLIVCPARP
ncbi:hypothetical protein HH310_28055 [Actinoplanes sp. TBRC 11911]|nr:hypothetical protein [Actinoplanes sp. TBRC 11911]